MKNYIKKHKDMIIIGAVLIGLSIVLHYGHYLIFHDKHHLLIFLVADIAFIPLEVFFVTMVLDRILEKREKAHLMEKMNMLIGLFFTEMGMDLLGHCTEADPQIHQVQEERKITAAWKKEDYRQLEKQLRGYDHTVAIEKMDLAKVKHLLNDHKDLLVSLIANPSLLEHDRFSELLMSVSHLQQELAMRADIEDGTISTFDLDHLKVDVERVYGHIGLEWLFYMKHLKENYPYLYVTALINNPYDQRDRVAIETDIRKTLYPQMATD